MSDLKVLFLYPGPTYNTSHEMFQNKYLLLSQYFSGYIYTTSEKNEKLNIGKFVYKSIFAVGKLGSLKLLIFCLRNALKLKENQSIDCIIAYDPIKTGFIACILKLFFNSKIIVEINGDYTSPVVWTDEVSDCTSKVKRLIALLMTHFVLSFADGVKLLNPNQMEKYKKLKKVKEIAVFPDWVPVSFFNNLGEDKEVLFVGFPFHIKGVDTLIKGFKKIASKFPDWKLKIMGWYPDPTTLNDAIGGHPQIYHHLPVPRYDVPEHIGKCGVFVLPSRSEAMGRVLLESAAAGKPRIGSNVDGIPTVIEDGVDGFLFEPESVDQLAEKMSMLMSDPKLRLKIGTAARKRVIVEFSEKKYIENYKNFIDRVVTS